MTTIVLRLRSPGRIRGEFPLFPLIPRRIWHANGMVPSPRTIPGGAGPRDV